MMTEHTGIVAHFDRADIDTDQILPKQFLKRVERIGFGEFLFYDWRYDESGNKRKDFILNKKPYDSATVLLARRNFGCGSSREHAVWALRDFGFRVIISPKFANIFYDNAFKNGLLLITLSEEITDMLFKNAYKSETVYQITVDLKNQVIIDSFGLTAQFEIDPFKKRCIMEGLDEIGLTLQFEDKIAEYERRHKNL